MKRYEMEEAGRRLMPNLPVMARLDGRAFHTFTKGLSRPFSREFSNCMVSTAAALIEEFHADLAYTQSDEITLFWHNSDPLQEMKMKGRLQKWHSLIAAEASVAFYQSLFEHLPEKAKKGEKRPTLDCRVWQVPNLIEVYNNFVWREDDATRNSLQMAAQALYTQEELHGQREPQLHDLLYAKGVNWNDYPAFFKRGTYIARRKYQRVLSPAELDLLQEEFRPKGPVIRSATCVLDALPVREYKSILPFIDGTMATRHVVGEQLK